jgi:hypothetical protein
MVAVKIIKKRPYKQSLVWLLKGQRTNGLKWCSEKWDRTLKTKDYKNIVRKSLTYAIY